MFVCLYIACFGAHVCLIVCAFVQRFVCLIVYLLVCFRFFACLLIGWFACVCCVLCVRVFGCGRLLVGLRGCFGCYLVAWSLFVFVCLFVFVVCLSVFLFVCWIMHLFFERLFKP